MSTLTLKLTPALHAALLQSVENSLDMLGDMALDATFLAPNEVRKLAMLPDEEIRATITKNQEEAWRQIDQYTSLQLLYTDLKDK